MSTENYVGAGQKRADVAGSGPSKTGGSRALRHASSGIRRNLDDWLFKAVVYQPLARP